MSITRFVDEGLPLGAYAKEVLCHCPKCNGPALVRGDIRYSVPFIFRKARVQCLRCTFVSEVLPWKGWHGPVVGYARQRCSYCGYKWLTANVRRNSIGPKLKRTHSVCCPTCGRIPELQLKWFRDGYGDRPIDPYFGLPLWLQTECCGEVLWAFGREHLKVLRAYVAAAHRERSFNGKWSMVTRLPKWMKSAKNRDAVLKCLDRLDDRLKAAQC